MDIIWIDVKIKIWRLYLYIACNVLFVAGMDLTWFGFVGRPHYFIGCLAEDFNVVVFNSLQYWKKLFKRLSCEYVGYFPSNRVRVVDGYISF